ncbi:MAG TPA: phosphomannomutase/phosphoglucomutase [Acidimicrobiales bacterium]|nr:phosphomannomutase/phosphoglucomutase [Acidimicrobiales bacterium]
MGPLDAIFKAYDVRGIVPDQLDEGVARRVGAAFARFAADDGRERGEPVDRVLVARDMRPSGEGLASAFAAGVTEQGLDVVDLGLASTDLIYFAAGSLDAPGAMFTASHNPAQYNGVKLCLAGARPVGQDTGLARIKADTEAGLPPAATTGSTSSQDILGAYADHVRSFADPAVLRPLRIVADTANGMGGLVAPAVFEGLPFDVEYLYVELDGTFPNHPADPIQAENLRDLQARVLERGADVGLAFDGDADRVFLVDERAQPVSGSLTTALVASGMLAKHPGATILHNLICSKAVPEIVRERGGTPVRTKVGHSFIKQVMLETGAVFGGEHSGHYYFRENYRADSGLVATMVVLEQLCAAAVPLSELLAPLDRYADSGEVNSTVSDPLAVIEKVAEAHADADLDRLDGLTVDHGSWWFNLRPSNTEPLLRLNLEAPTPEECEARTAEVLSLIREEA